MSGKKLQALAKGIANVSSFLNYIAMGLLFILMLQGVADVVGRYLFNKPIIGTMERGEVLLALMVFLGWGYTQIVKGHVSLDFFVAQLSPRVLAIVNFATTFLVLVLFILIIWQGVITAQLYHEGDRLIYVIHWPLAPFQLVVPLSAFVLCLVLIMEMIQLFFQIKRGD